MKRNSLQVLVAVMGLLLASTTVVAHHSVSAEFDTNKPIEFSGTLKMVEWTNPHSYTVLEVKAADGKVNLYRVETGAPNSLYRQGWRKDSVKIGTPVTFKGVRAKNPDSNNVNGVITLPNGKRMFVGEGPSGAQEGAS